MTANRTSLANFSRTSGGIGIGHFMLRFRPKAPESINDIMPTTRVKPYLKVAGETLGSAVMEDLEPLKAAYEKIDKTIISRDNIDRRRIFAMALTPVVGASVADTLVKLGTPNAVVRITLWLTLAAFSVLAINLWKRIRNNEKLMAFKTEIENKLGEWGIVRTESGYWI